MIKSMTGFGRGEEEGWVTEIRTVNHRFSDTAFRIPRNLSSLESRFKEEIKKRIKRGRIEVHCNHENTIDSSALTVLLNEELAEQIHRHLLRLKERFGFEQEVDLSLLASFREIFKTQEESPDLDKIWKTLQPSLAAALDSHDEMRCLEGKILLQGLEGSLGVIREVCGKITECAVNVVEKYRERLVKRLGALVPEDELDQGRLLQEVAIFADRSDITEELTRISSHIQQFEEAIGGPGPQGRRFDFLLQEMNREVNTIGSKGNDVQISQWIVDCKCELEKMREQVQNVE